MARGLFAATLLSAGFCVGASPSAIAQDTAAIERAVKICVDQVHRFVPPEEYLRQFFQQFDAYYNAASGTVQNNGYRNGDMPAQYQFNKCMATQGFPLK